MLLKREWVSEKKLVLLRLKVQVLILLCQTSICMPILSFKNPVTNFWAYLHTKREKEIFHD
jgi:hypothetical protein